MLRHYEMEALLSILEANMSGWRMSENILYTILYILNVIIQMLQYCRYIAATFRCSPPYFARLAQRLLDASLLLRILQDSTEF
jgi:hypothetical protein